MTAALARLPRIVRFLGTNDCPGGSCPHCGATGRWIHTFELEDGRRGGAMSGCIQLFPISPIAVEQMRLDKKMRDGVEQFGRGFALNRWDQAAASAIDAFLAGACDEASTLREIALQRSSAAAWRRRRFR